MVLNPAKKPRGKGAPPTTAENATGTENTTKSSKAVENEPLNFKVSEEFAMDWRMFCAANKMKQKELLIKAFEFYKSHHGG
jgi:hypothetical protein